MKAVFHGELANQFGSDHTFTASTVYLLTQGLILQLGDAYKKYIADGKWIISVAGQEIDPQQVHQKFDTSAEVHFQPAVEGESNVAKIIVGAVLIVVGIVTGNPFLIKVGALVALQGVAGILAKKPSLPNQNTSDQNPNYFFNGGTNTEVEGGPVPLVYGRVQRAGSTLISQGITIGQVQ